MEGLGVINRQAVENIVKFFLLIFLEIYSVNKNMKTKKIKTFAGVYLQRRAKRRLSCYLRKLCSNNKSFLNNSCWVDIKQGEFRVTEKKLEITSLKEKEALKELKKRWVLLKEIKQILGKNNDDTKGWLDKITPLFTLAEKNEGKHLAFKIISLEDFSGIL